MTRPHSSMRPFLITLLFESRQLLLMLLLLNLDELNRSRFVHGSVYLVAKFTSLNNVSNDCFRLALQKAQKAIGRKVNIKYPG